MDKRAKGTSNSKYGDYVQGGEAVRQALHTFFQLLSVFH
jgi:hypothetical protein